MKTETDFQCAVCKGVFERERDDSEAMKEANERHPDLKIEESMIVCDDCFNKYYSTIYSN